MSSTWLHKNLRRSEYRKNTSDSNPSTPTGFLRTNPEYFTFDKNVKPLTPEGQNQSQMTPRTMISNVVEKFSENFTVLPKSSEVSGDKRQSSDYLRGREHSRSPSREYNQNWSRGRSNTFDRRQPQRYYTGAREANRASTEASYAGSSRERRDSYPREYSRSNSREQNYQSYPRSTSPYIQPYFDNNPFRPRGQSQYRQNPYGYQNYPVSRTSMVRDTVFGDRMVILHQKDNQ